MTSGSSLHSFLRERRTRLDPAALGYAGGRRRTPGLRREEVAQRAGISSTWYSWLEQGRGGAPSAQVLERLSTALMLTEAEREHLFVLGLGRPPEIRYQAPSGVTPRLQRVLDALDASPALIRTATWDVIAWNRAAVAVLADYDALPPAERNVLRLMFLEPASARDEEWENVAQFVVGVFRGDIARTGAAAMVQALVEDLCANSADFARMWRDSEVRGSCEGMRHFHHPGFGDIALEFSTFAVDGRPDLAMLVYSPVSPDDTALVRALVERRETARRDQP
tara:strand:- start:26983 stop:27822 length:840 start_codon:yes stop_codon:yes gene_type:complete